MSTYKRILVTTDLLPESRIIVGRAGEVADLTQAELHVLHVISPAYPQVLNLMENAHYMAQVDIQEGAEEVVRAVKQGMHVLAKELAIDDAVFHVRHGYIQDIIADLVHELQLDLIVLGAHTRYGFKLFSTTKSDKVLHAASCDVLAVRVP
tara:strand:- start:115 stop:567 length:453 start_codon:yes stop_codon:yes gene_type:complete